MSAAGVRATLIVVSKWQEAASALLPLLLGAAFAGNASAPMSYGFAASAVLIAVWLTMHARRTPRVDAGFGEVAVDDAGVRVGEHFIPRREIRRARIAARGAHSTVMLDRGPLRLAVGLRMGDADAHAVVKALELDAARVRDRFRTRGPGGEDASRAFPIVMSIACVALLLLIPSLEVTLFGFAVFFALPLVFGASHVDVGPDGVTLRWHFWTWHAPLRDIVELRRVASSRKGVLFHLVRRRGPPIAIVFGARPYRATQKSSSADPDATAFEARIEELLAERDGAPEELVASFELAAKHGQLRALSSAETFRSSGFTVADVKRILSDGRLRAGTRARAAVVLGNRAETTRIAEQTTHPRLRLALERAAQDEPIEALLAELDAELSAKP